MVDISTEKAKDEAVEMQRLKWRQAGKRRREKEKAILEGDDSEAKEKVMRSRRKRAARRRATERKTVDKSALRGTIHSTTNHPLQKSSTSSTTLRTRSSRATTTKARQSHRELLINTEVNEIIQEALAKTADIQRVFKDLSKQFVWYPKSEETREGIEEKEEDKEETTTMWFHPSATEYHAWFTVRPSSLPKNTFDLSAGYGVFAERNFQKDDTISVYLGQYVEGGIENAYCMYQRSTKKRVLVKDGFPRYRKMYLGAHMLNDYNWDKNGNDCDKTIYNVEFHSNLSLVATRDIKAGEELFVFYNTDDTATI